MYSTNQQLLGPFQATAYEGIKSSSSPLRLLAQPIKHQSAVGFVSPYFAERPLKGILKNSKKRVISREFPVVPPRQSRTRLVTFCLPNLERQPEEIVEENKYPQESLETASEKNHLSKRPIGENRRRRSRATGTHVSFVAWLCSIGPSFIRKKSPFVQQPLSLTIGTPISLSFSFSLYIYIATLGCHYYY